MSEEKDAVTISSEGGGVLRAAVRDVVAPLRELHLGLVDFARGEYEREHGLVAGAGEMLKLLLHDPAFDWLRTLSALMVEIDELLDEDIVTPADAAAVRGRIEMLITRLDSEASEFSRRYLEALQADASIVMAHAAVRSSLALLPAAERADIPVASQTGPSSE
jgi:hypothetical protein